MISEIKKGKIANLNPGYNPVTSVYRMEYVQKNNHNKIWVRCLGNR